MPHGHLPQVTSINRPTKPSPAHRERFFIETCCALINQSITTDFSHTNSNTNSNIITVLPHRIGISGPCIARQGQNAVCVMGPCSLYCYFETLYIEMLFLAGSLCTFDLTQSFWPLTQVVQKKIHSYTTKCFILCWSYLKHQSHLMSSTLMS